MQRRDFIKTMAGAGMCSMLCSSCTFWQNENLVGSEFIYKTKAELPKKLHLEVCSLCQLNCAACWVRLDEENLKKTGCFGYLKFSDFKNLVDDNSQLEEIELSYRGEIFLNPELDKIIKYAYEKNIILIADTGVNLNTLSDETAENLVKYQFKRMEVSIDGATPEVYKIYRRQGDLNKVIANIKKINEYKKKYNSKYPEMIYKFIIFNHNIEDIPLAKTLAKELDMKIKFTSNIQPWYAPLSKEQKIRAEKLSGITLESKTCAKLTFDNYKKKESSWFFCQTLFEKPQIGWDGKLLGCNMLLDKDFGVNVFKEGLFKALNCQNVLYAKKMLTDFSTSPKKGLVCSDCYVYKMLKDDNYEMYSDRDLI